jgi:hypothetical protein
MKNEEEIIRTVTQSVPKLLQCVHFVLHQKGVGVAGAEFSKCLFQPEAPSSRHRPGCLDAQSAFTLDDVYLCL